MNPVNDNAVLKQYAAQLLAWNKGMNLIGKSTESDVWDTHISDSLQLLPYIENDGCKTVVDIGSGGGLPVIPLSIMLPDKEFYATEVDSKKIAFLEFITKKLKLNTHAIDINLPFQLESECIITSRAFSEIKNILLWAEKHAPSVKAFYLLKGRREIVEMEFQQAEKELAKYPSREIIDLKKGCLVVLRP